MGTALTFNIPAMIAHQGRVRADHPALISGQDEVSYGSLEHQVCQWSNHFVDLGLRPGDRVGLCLVDTVEHVIAMLAALRAQLPFISMDWKSARREVERRAVQFDLKLVLCHNERSMPSQEGVLCDDGWRWAVGWP